jgi:hypothetical protein
MEPVENLAQLVREKAERLRELDAEAARLRIELDEIRSAVADVARMNRKTRTRIKNRKKGSRLPARADSNVGAASRVLLTAGHPLHIDVLLPAVVRTVGKHVTKAGLVGQLSEYVRREEIFTRPQASTFGLRIWESQEDGLPDKSEVVVAGEG